MPENGEPAAGVGDDALIQHAIDTVQNIISIQFAKVQSTEMPALGQRLEKLHRLVGMAQVAFADEVDQRGMAASHSVSSTRVLLQQMLHIPVKEAGLRVRTARAIYPQDLPSGGETPVQLPVLGAAVRAGLVDADHTQTILATMKRLPDTLDVETVGGAEQSLVDFAVDMDPDQFRKVAQHLENALNPDGPEPDDRDPSSRVEFHIGSRSAATGLTSINGKLDDLSVEVLRTVIDSLAAPKAATAACGAEDPTGGAPAGGGTAAGDGPGETIKDPRSAAVRRAHALIEALNLTLTHGSLPAHGGMRPQVTITMQWDVLKHRIAHAVTDHGATLSPATTRRLLCDATVIPAVLNGDSEVLDLGRSKRTFNRATRRAIALRDKGCAFPGCDRPPAYCDCHHIEWWVRDCGDTSLKNGCLLCQYHHTEIHKGEWTITLNDDGLPVFIPPKWVDPEQRPRRNTVHLVAPPL